MKHSVQLQDVERLSLLELSRHLTTAYGEDSTSISGAVFAHFAKELLAAETHPGGPYRHKKNGEEMPLLNATIGRLFILMGHPLPNVDVYLTSLNPSHLSPDALVALKLYKAAQKATAPSDEHASSIANIPYVLARETLHSLHEPLKTQALQFLERVEQADATNEIACLARFSSRSLDSTIPDETLDLLGEANIHGWIAYMIYDHIIDHEASVDMLPLANICMRLSLRHYQRALPADHPLHTHITQYFDQIDSASAWELAHCRFTVSQGTIHIDALPDYKEYEQLARRTMIHILGPVIVAALTESVSSKSRKLKYLVQGLEHYLVARQLSDDIHDWRDDLKCGRISAVVAYLLDTPSITSGSTYDIDKLTSTLQQRFLRQTSGDISTLIAHHAKTAKKSLEMAGCAPSSELIEIVTRLENMAVTSIDQQSRFLEFQKKYQDEHL